MHKNLYHTRSLSLQLTLFVLLQPFIDMYRLFVGNAIELAGISLVEWFNFILIGYLAVLFILNQRRLKAFAPAICYGFVLAVYFVLHCLNMLQFDTTIINGTAISTLTEVYVMIRAYLLPLMALYMMFYIRTERQAFEKSIIALAWIISGVIVLTNLFQLSYISYASELEGNEMIRGSILTWFSKSFTANMTLYTSKGWFYSGNQIGLILFILFPMVIYHAIVRRKPLSFIQVLLHAIAMIMVGTKTAAVGSMLLLIVMIVLSAFFSILNKSFKSFSIPLLAMLGILVISYGLFSISPTYRMAYQQQESYKKTEAEEKLQEEFDTFVEQSEKKESPKIDQKAVSKYLNRSYYMYGINKEYIDLFPIEKNAEFWLSVVGDPEKKQVNFRDFKQRIYQQVLEQNQNPKDPWLGIGYTTNFPYVEKDIISQNVWFGYIGTILLIGPFFLLLLACGLRILLHWKRNFTFYHCTLALCACGGIGGSFVAGHLFGFAFPAIILAYILAQFYHSTANKEEETV